MRVGIRGAAALIACCGALAVHSTNGQAYDAGSQYQTANFAAVQAGASWVAQEPEYNVYDDYAQYYDDYSGSASYENQAAGYVESAASYAQAGYVQDASWNNASSSCSSCDGSGCSSCQGGRATGVGLAGRPMQIFAGAEYIYARASFSEALAYVEQFPGQGENFVEHEFDYKSSYSFYGGLRWVDCGGAIVFDFDRYRSTADLSVQDNPSSAIFGTYETDPGPGGVLNAGAEVDLKSYDLAFEKTIPLGSPLGCCNTCCDGCAGDPCAGDQCGCDACCAWCPAWDITWSAGLRFADVDWSRGATAFDNFSVQQESFTTRMSFQGAGARVGLEGRRYFGRQGAFSMFARGDWSLLVGDVDINYQTNIPGVGNAFINNSGRRVIPVTEIEAGATLHIRNHVNLSAGYFISAWHDLGFRDEYVFNNSFQISHFDDANILGFDGLFARAEVAF